MVSDGGTPLPDRCEVVVVGGGLAGLAAAWRLRDRDVIVLEATDRIGGRLRSEPREDVWLNFGGHVFAGPDSGTGRLLAAVGLEARDLPGRLAAVAMGRKIVASGAVETYPFRLPLSWRSRLALIRAGIRLRLDVRAYGKAVAARPGEDAQARQARVLRFHDDASFMERYGRLPDDVDAIFRCTLTRSSGEPEVLAAGYGIGYFHLVWDRTGGLTRGIVGGPTRLTAALANALGGRVRCSTRATAVTRGADGVTVHVDDNGTERTIACDHVVVATTAPVAHEILQGIPADVSDALAAVHYGPYAVGAFLVDAGRPLPWRNLYALATPGRSFSMLFNPANVLEGSGDPPAHGSLMVYSAAAAGAQMLAASDEEIARRFEADLVDLFPEIAGRVREVVIQRWQQGTPYPHVGRGRLQEALTRDLGTVHLAGDYLGTRATETAALTAAIAAERIRDRLPLAP